MSNWIRIVGVLAVTLLLAACTGGGSKPFTILSGSENTDLEPIVKEFCQQKGFDCTFKYEGSLDIGLALGSSSGVDADAVWPASGVWIDLFDTGRKVKNATSIAQMPVILGVKLSKAQELGWVGKDVRMADILVAVRAGKLKFLMTSATQSNSGASAYLSMLTSALGGKSVIEPGDLDRADVRQTVKDLLGGVERSSGSSGWLADLYVKTTSEGTQPDAMWNYEAVLKTTNDRLKQAGKELLYAIYPADGVAVADSPLGFIDRGKGGETGQFFHDLVSYLQTEPVEQRIADTGRRIPLAGSIAGKPDSTWNFDPTKLVTAIRLPEPAVIRQALDLYQSALRKPSLTALCLDYSGSMEGNGEDQLEQAMTFLLTPDEASKVLVQWSPDDRILVFPFDSGVRESFSATGAPADQRQLLSDVIAESANGGTDMYSCAQDALQAIEKMPDLGNYLPAIVIMTDGRTDGTSNAFLGDWRAAPVRVPVFGIIFGDAEASQLNALADATSARVFDGKADLAGAFRAARGYN